MGRYRAIMTDTDRSYISGEGDASENQRLQSVSRVRNRITEELPQDIEILREHHPQLYGELREVVCDNSPGPDQLQDALADCRSERDDLQAALDDCREQLAAADEVDTAAVSSALDDIEAAAERGDGQAIQTALSRARDALEDSDDE
jgi:hypothetical protein